MCTSSSMTGGTCSASPATEARGLRMVRTLLIRGMLVGILAGLLSSGFAWLFGEPQVDHAIAFEEHMRQRGARARTGQPHNAEHGWAPDRHCGLWLRIRRHLRLGVRL